MPRTERLAPCFRASAGRIPQRRLVCLYSDATAIARIFTGRIPQRLRACSCTRFFITIHFSPSHAPPEVRSCPGQSGSLPASAPPPGGFCSGGSFACTAMRQAGRWQSRYLHRGGSFACPAMRRRSRASPQGGSRSGFAHAVVPGLSSLWFCLPDKTMLRSCRSAAANDERIRGALSQRLPVVPAAPLKRSLPPPRPGPNGIAAASLPASHEIVSHAVGQRTACRLPPSAGNKRRLFLLKRPLPRLPLQSASASRGTQPFGKGSTSGPFLFLDAFLTDWG